jgi:hypothetical protein
VLDVWERGGGFEYVVTERKDLNKLETLDMQKIYCLIKLTSIHRSFRGTTYVATNTECALRNAQFYST